MTEGIEKLTARLIDIESVNKSQSIDIANLQASLRGAENESRDLKKLCAALLDRIEGIDSLLAGDETGNFGFIQIRSLVRGLQSNTKLLGRGFGALGLGGVIAVVSAVTGWGNKGNTEFVFLSTYQLLEKRVDTLELDQTAYENRWKTTLQKAESQLTYPTVTINGVEQ